MGFFHLTYYERANPLNQASVEYEEGPVARYMNAEEKVKRLEAENRSLMNANHWLTFGIGDWCVRSQKADQSEERTRMLLVNLYTATCPYAHDPDASEALIEVRREIKDGLGLLDCDCKAVAARVPLSQYLSEV